MGHSQIEIKEQELGIIMPESMKDFYHYYGNSEEIRHAFYIFSPIENICIEDSALVFGYTSQMIAKLGIVLESLKSKYQSISFYLDDIKKWFSEGAIFPEAFFFNIVGWQILNIMPVMAKVEIDENKFYILCQKEFQLFSQEKRFAKGYKIIACKHDDILACYLREEDELEWDMEWL